ncbi:hypothetical protein [Ensifer sesbaniae]|uniref:hypothetical protein n=1 Tax=Ensifer sesbaniae TaxID=1214071 RepID=UPI001569D55B|nr:hypothetical protein [Ensifer sesbaniae]NRQ18324.1 hypothetical protein [Ensifer sesbaniae]
MKPEKKPFVVEIKNRRRLSRKEHSIWGKIDLKAAGDQVGAEERSGEHDAPMQNSDVAAEQNAEINV